MVANEVKNLANQTTDATDRISSLIENVQSITDEVIGFLESIKQTANENASHLKEVGEAIADQRHESENARERSLAVANQVKDMLTSFEKVGAASKNSSEVSRTMQDSSQTVIDLLSELRAAIEDFIETVQSSER